MDLGFQLHTLLASSVQPFPETRHAILFASRDDGHLMGSEADRTASNIHRLVSVAHHRDCIADVRRLPV